MPRRANIERTTALLVRLPETLKAKVDVHLWSSAEGRIPLGAHQRFFTRLLTEYFVNLETQNALQPRNE